MIREATTDDISGMLGLFEELRAAIACPQAIDRAYVGAMFAALIRDGGLALVVDRCTLDGFIVASIERSRINPEPVAVEHGWYCRAPGWGARLLTRYEAWARERGAAAICMTTGYVHGRAGGALQRSGYRPAEVAWVKRI